MKPFTKIAAIVLALVALLHLARVVLNMQVSVLSASTYVGNFEIPMWVSVVGFVVPFLLSIGLWRESK